MRADIKAGLLILLRRMSHLCLIMHKATATATTASATTVAATTMVRAM